MTDYAVNESGCWVWQGPQTGRGYGAIRRGSKNMAAHRVFYEESKGPIPTGLVLDHLCRNRLCVNPAHLEPVTEKENTLRGVGPTAINSGRSHCPNGHPYKGRNLMMRRGRRYCRMCNYAHTLRYKRKLKAALSPTEPPGRGG